MSMNAMLDHPVSHGVFTCGLAGHDLQLSECSVTHDVSSLEEDYHCWVIHDLSSRRNLHRWLHWRDWLGGLPSHTLPGFALLGSVSRFPHVFMGNAVGRCWSLSLGVENTHVEHGGRYSDGFSGLTTLHAVASRPVGWTASLN